ncbi:MAG: hypothetical protein ACRDTR_05630, partial [Rubrobacter sp.]
MPDANPGPSPNSPPRDASDGGPGALVTLSARGSMRPPNNLPLELSSFVGWEMELAEVKRLLEGN